MDLAGTEAPPAPVVARLVRDRDPTTTGPAFVGFALIGGRGRVKTMADALLICHEIGERKLELHGEEILAELRFG